jgi:hypothetical protein
MRSQDVPAAFLALHNGHNALARWEEKQKQILHFVQDDTRWGALIQMTRGAATAPPLKNHQGWGTRKGEGPRQGAGISTMRLPMND